MSSTEVTEPVFTEWPKIARWNRDVTITEKIDGSNGGIIVTADGRVAVQSRSKIITPETDNHGFAAWAYTHAEALAGVLGEGLHMGEWYGSGVQKRAGYGLEKGMKKFALFNVHRWRTEIEENPDLYEMGLDVVPLLWQGFASEVTRGDGYGGIEIAMRNLRTQGSFVRSAQGRPDVKPEGIIIFHHAGNVGFKMTMEKDDEWKGKNA